MKVFMVGVVTGLTEGTVVFVDKDRLMVKADNQTGIFSRPGDSGSLVFIKQNGLNVVIGILGCIDAVIGLTSHNFYHCIQPIVLDEHETSRVSRS